MGCVVEEAAYINTDIDVIFKKLEDLILTFGFAHFLPFCSLSSHIVLIFPLLRHILHKCEHYDIIIV